MGPQAVHAEGWLARGVRVSVCSAEGVEELSCHVRSVSAQPARGSVQTALLSSFYG